MGIETGALWQKIGRKEKQKHSLFSLGQDLDGSDTAFLWALGPALCMPYSAEGSSQKQTQNQP